MSRSYTILDLVRFHRFCQKNPTKKPHELITDYNKKHPELSEYEKSKNILKFFKNELNN